MTRPNEIEDLVRDENFWFDDGNVVITSGTIGWKIHKSVLSRSSPAFREFFAVTPTDGIDQRYGCPVVILEDHPDDIRLLLRALYDGRHLRAAWARFNVIAAWVRMGAKYRIDDLRDGGLRRLESCFCDNMYQWDLVSYEPPELRFYGITLHWRDCIATVNLARIANTQSALPLAMYVCCTLDTRTLLNGIEYTRGRVEKLDEADIVRCLDARPKFMVLQQQIVDNLARVERYLDGYPDIGDHAHCMRAFRRIADAIRAGRPSAWNGDPEGGKYDVLQSWKPAIEKEGAGLCELCREKIIAADAEERMKVWLQLPKLLGLR
ncbi:hypothetical protein WOLCODRAFT_25737 [Wolfiporia cocos MD-104 SS10]|uniref:BTB domain-containing protein n=1 Tax=Wolfiporia cocos (strain MD-104) TaxID=742152 RepID=A0A2H3JMK2_WOLCO|nr:hypothetical protein WOLCODRAFT_25737 [Wolfiporia cocos MD-104 SS10]